MTTSAIKHLVQKYRDEMTDRDNELNPYRDENGDVPMEEQEDYDAERIDNAFSAEVDLIALLDELEALIPEEEKK